MSEDPKNTPDGEGGGGSPDDLLTKAAEGKDLSQQEHHDLLEYYLNDGELPGHAKPLNLSLELGSGADSKLFAVTIGSVVWEHDQEAIARAAYTDGRKGFDQFVRASVLCGYAITSPNLAGTVLAQQKEADKKGMIEDPKRPGEKIKAPKDSAMLLRRIFESEPGPLIELSEVVLQRLKMSRMNGPSVYDRDTLTVEAGKG